MDDSVNNSAKYNGNLKSILPKFRKWAGDRGSGSFESEYT
jgi:hypothetical protein